jgi:hypothetical protein
MSEISDDDFTKKLEKIRKKWAESEELSAESFRRQQVTQEKFYGWLIEWIQSQRDKMKEKTRVALLSGILHRITDLRNHVLMEYLSHIQSGKFELLLTEEQESKLKPSVMKMVELYRNIRIDLTELFKDDPMSRNLPHVPRSIANMGFKLKELNMCLGQLMGYVFGKMMELTS